MRLSSAKDFSSRPGASVSSNLLRMFWSAAIRSLDCDVTWPRISLKDSMLDRHSVGIQRLADPRDSFCISTGNCFRSWRGLWGKSNPVKTDSRKVAPQFDSPPERHCCRKGRRVVGMIETTRRILAPTREFAIWRCSDCAWSQPFVQRLEVVENEPPKAIGDAFDRHKCTEHRHPKWVRAIP